MEFDLGTWKFIDSIKVMESHGISFQYCEKISKCIQLVWKLEFIGLNDFILFLIYIRYEFIKLLSLRKHNLKLVLREFIAPGFRIVDKNYL